jgi:hypothetical protein
MFMSCFCIKLSVKVLLFLTRPIKSPTYMFSRCLVFYAAVHQNHIRLGVALFNMQSYFDPLYYYFIKSQSRFLIALAKI